MKFRRNRSWVQICGAFLVSVSLSIVGGVSQRAEAFTARNLAYGCQGYDVDELQSRLHLLGYYWGAINGDFNWTTYWAVRTFQYNFGIKATGFVDMTTKVKLADATPTWQSTSSGSQTADATSTTSSQPATTISSPISGISASDMNLMAHMVYGEARGEPFNGQVAIAAVILNRLHSPLFPHTIPGILYSPGAFDALTDGQFNLTPDASAIKAVEDAVQGWDPSHGAIYYFNPATATSQWIWSRPEIITIGHHIFCS